MKQKCNFLDNLFGELAAAGYICIIANNNTPKIRTLNKPGGSPNNVFLKGQNQ